MAPLIYRIEVRGPLPARVLDELTGFTLDASPRTTTLSGPLADTAALYGLIARLEALGLALVSVRPLTDPARDGRHDHPQPERT